MDQDAVQHGRDGERDPSPVDPWALVTRRRYRFLLPLCQDRVVWDASPAAGGAAQIAAVAASVVTDALEPADIVLSLTPVSPAEVAERIAGLGRRLAPEGILAIAVTDRGDSEDHHEALRQRFTHVACFRERPVVGAIILPERFAQSRMIPLQAGAPASAVSLYLCSDVALPSLAGGLFEEPPGTPSGTPNVPAPAYEPVALGTVIDDVAAVFQDRVAEPADTALRERAVALVERLLTVEQETVNLRMENHRLRTRPGGGGGSGEGSNLDTPQDRHDWPLAEHSELLPSDLGPYDRRADDAVLLEGRKGDAFFAAHGLLGEVPDYAGAVDALNALQRVLRLHDADADGSPDVSIVIPIYGQLSYTLNCLDSLLSHRSHYSAEIIIIDDRSPDVSGDFLPLVSGIRYHLQPLNGGFIQSCTTGAALARGRFLILLNNDTRVVAGWLDEMVGTFALFPGAGAVGSKLFYPDGVLQEAGGIIWRDGTAWNYGRNDDPNRPQYCHARQVDYVSGASLCVPMDVWRELDGFDQRYRPAYCEDSDLCLRIRQAGREMWLQPLSRIVHYEGKTSGTDTSTGVKANQVVNQKKLFMRWREQLTQHRPNGQAPLLERERPILKRALVVDATAPTPKQDAGSVTTTLTLGLFRDLGFKPHFVPQDNFLFQDPYITDLHRMGVECAYAPFDTSFETYMQRYGPLLDVVLVYRVTVLEKTLETIRKYAPQAPVLFHNMDLHFLRMEREAAMSGSAEAAAEAAAMRVKECDLIGQVDCTITHSTYEKEILGEIVPDAPVVVWPFMFEFFGTEVGFEPRRDIVFLGGYRHRPNVDAVKFFAQDVFPLIRQQEPNARFVIAGANPSDDVLALASDSVIVTGMVDDLRDVFDTSRLFACSLRIGAGTKGKVSTAMSYGLPVVSTMIGAEGMDLIDGEDVLLADDPESFAEACLRLYRDKDLWEKISRNGQTLVQENHSLAMGRRVLAEAIDVAYRHRLGLSEAA